MTGQQRSALEAANRVRFGRAELKDAIHADPTWRTLLAVVEGTRGRELVQTEPVTAYLAEAPGLGPIKARRACIDAGLDVRQTDAVPFGWLTPRTRNGLVKALLMRHSTMTPAVLERLASKPRTSKRKHTTRGPR